MSIQFIIILKAENAHHNEIQFENTIHKKKNLG
jgi:hypothetical protein